MKWHIFTYLLLFLFANYSCKETSYPQILLDANNLCYTQPDSAVNLLKSIKNEMSHYSEKVQRYYQLLCIKANDKAYLPLTTDSLILPIVQYYTNEYNKEHLPEALFYAGRIYRDMGDAPRAISYFYQAKDAAHQGTPAELKSLICNQMGSLFHEQCMYPEAIINYIEGYQYSCLKQDTIGMIYDLVDISSIYAIENIPDSALLHLQKAYTLAKTTNRQRLLGIVNGKLASLYTQIEDFEAGKQAIQQSLKVTDQRMQSGIYAIAAELYKKAGLKDSAKYYYSQLMDCGSIYARTDAAWNLAEYALQNGKAHSAQHYLKEYIKGVQEVWEHNDTETIRKLRSLYNYNTKEKENQQLKIENKQKQIYLFFALGSIAVALLGFFNYYLYSKKEKAELNLQLMKLKHLKDELEKRKAEESDKNEEKKYLQASIYQYVEDCILSETFIPSSKWEELETIINDIHNGFINKLSEICKLNTFEKQVCLLLKINTTPTHIAKLTNHSKEAVSATRRRLYKKFFGQKGTPQQWDDFIGSL